MLRLAWYSCRNRLKLTGISSRLKLSLINEASFAADKNAFIHNAVNVDRNIKMTIKQTMRFEREYI